MTQLDREHLFSADLPEGAHAASAALARLNALTEEQRASGHKSAEAKSEARATYAQLLIHIAPLRQDDEAVSLGPPEELRDRFVEGVLLWMQFCQTSSVPLIDSVGTRSIRVFPIDLPPDAAAFAELERALGKSQGLGARELDQARRRVAHLCSALPLKIALTRALAARLSGAAHFADLMRECYGELPLRAGDVDFVLTSTGIFFVLPLAGDRLDVPDWELRPEAERAVLQAFLARIARENLTETWRFPAFGLFDPEHLDPRLVAELSQAVGVRADVVQAALLTMISILPKSEIDQYLVHDAWGHTWQEVLNEFEWEYARLRAVSAPLALLDGPKFGGPETPAFGTAFRAHGGNTVLCESALLKIAEADLRGRFQVGLSQALSEVLADFVEAKFSRLNPTYPLPTSSLLPSDCLKLDLTIQDVLRQARRCQRPYRNLWSKPEERERWVHGLTEQGLPEAGAEAAVARAASLLESTFGAALRPVIAGGSAASGTPVGSTLATRALLELTLFCSELELVLVETAAHRASPAWKRPVYCPDLWAVSLSHLYEGDRQNRFWSLDTLTRKSLKGACDALGRELEAASPGAL